MSTRLELYNLMKQAAEEEKKKDKKDSKESKSHEKKESPAKEKKEDSGKSTDSADSAPPQQGDGQAVAVDPATGQPVAQDPMAAMQQQSALPPQAMPPQQAQMGAPQMGGNAMMGGVPAAPAQPVASPLDAFGQGLQTATSGLNQVIDAYYALSGGQPQAAPVPAQSPNASAIPGMPQGPSNPIQVAGGQGGAVPPTSPVPQSQAKSASEEMGRYATGKGSGRTYYDFLRARTARDQAIVGGQPIAGKPYSEHAGAPINATERVKP